MTQQNEEMMNLREMQSLLSDCTLCPRSCHADRLAGQTGYCGQTAVLRVARAALHFWEEPCISGRAGSGAVFFGGCPLRCVYCQNYDIACGSTGKEISAERLAEIFLELQEKGANNINLVTPTHFVPVLVPALRAAKAAGLQIPVVYNTSSYEKVETLRLLDGLVDIYLPDLKYVSPRLSAALSHAPDYCKTAKAAIAEMVRQVGEPLFAAPDGRLLTAEQMNEACEESQMSGEDIDSSDSKKDGAQAQDADFLMKRGVIVRHLVLPGQTADSRRVLDYLYRTYKNRIYISIMNQYTPMPQLAERLAVSAGGGAEKTQPGSLTGQIRQEMLRKLTEEEYEAIVAYAIELGVENGFLQEGETAKESFIPSFDGEGV